MKEHSIFWWELFAFIIIIVHPILVCGIIIMLISIHKFKLNLIQLILAVISQPIMSIIIMGIYLLIVGLIFKEINLHYNYFAIFAEITTIPLMYYIVKKYNNKLNKINNDI